MKQPTVFVVTLLSLLFMCFTAALAQDTPNYHMGVPIDYDDQWTITINGAHIVQSLRDTTGTGTIRPTDGNVFLLVEVTLINRQHPDVETSVSSSAFSSTVTDGIGNAAKKIGSGSSTYCVSGGTSICSSTTTSSASSISTNFVYIVPSDAAPYTLIFDDVDTLPIRFTTEVVPPAEIVLPDQRIAATTIGQVEVIAIFLNYHTDTISTLDISPDSRRLVASSFARTSVWDLEANDEFATLAGRNAHFSPANSDLITLITFDSEANTHNVELYNLADSTSTVASSYIERASNAQFSPDGRLLISFGCDELRGFTNCADSKIHLYDVTSNSELAMISNGSFPILSRDGAILSYVEDDTKSVIVYDVSTQTVVHVIETETDNVLRAFSGDSRFLAVADTGALTIWNIGTGEAMSSVDGYHTVMAMTFTPDNTQLVVAGCTEAPRYSWCENEDARDMRAIDVASGETLMRIEMPQSVSSLSFALDGEALVLRSFGLSQYIDPASGEVLATMDESNYTVFNTDETFMATSGNNRVVKLRGLP